MESTKQAFNVLNIQKAISERYNPYENKDQHYIKFGEANDFPERLIWLSNHSSLHRTCLEAIIDAIFGEGLTSDKPELLDKANNEGETWNDIFQKVATDFKMFGYFSLETIWSKDRSKIAEVYHIDASYIRAKEKNHRGKIPGYFISSEWGKTRYKSSITLDEDQYLPIFNPNTNIEEPNQIYVFNPYRPGQKYYSVPDYIGALKVIELDTEIDNFHVNNIKNGLAPSLAITTFTNADEDQRTAIETMLRLQLSGTDQAGQMIYMDVDSPENAPVITPINQNGADGYYTTINDLVTQKILTAHRITSPEIFGIMEGSRLFKSKDEATNAYLLFLNTVIKPMQQDILGCLEYLLQFQNPGVEFSLGVIQTSLFKEDEEDKNVITSAEAETDEETMLENEINNK
jgi:hypothetical protein